MIRTIFIIMFISLFFMISSYANEYYCPYGDGSFDFNRDIYNTDDGCKQWNTDFWKECDPDLYSNCIKNQAILRKMYFEEKCENILNKIRPYIQKDGGDASSEASSENASSNDKKDDDVIDAEYTKE